MILYNVKFIFVLYNCFSILHFLQLRSTKSVDNKTTFMNFLADTINTKFSDVADFMEEIEHSRKAVRGNR